MKRIFLFIAFTMMLAGGNAFAADKLKVVTTIADLASLTLEVVGLELEICWLPPLLDQSRNDKIRVGARGYLDVSQGVEILDRPTGAVTRAMGDVHPLGNPHYW